LPTAIPRGHVIVVGSLRAGAVKPGAPHINAVGKFGAFASE